MCMGVYTSVYGHTRVRTCTRETWGTRRGRYTGTGEVRWRVGVGNVSQRSRILEGVMGIPVRDEITMEEPGVM